MKVLQLAIWILLCATNSSAHPYMPLRAGDVTVLDYHFGVDSDRPEIKATETFGKMTTTNLGEIEKNGRLYFHFKTSYSGISYMTQDAELWRREENGVLYLASMIKGEFSETVELPNEIAVGKEWDYFDGEKSIRKITGKTEILTKSGEKITDCLEVTRTILDRPALKDVINKDYYCKERGNSGSIFSQPSPIGTYSTETTLISNTTRSK